MRQFVTLGVLVCALFVVTQAQIPTNGLVAWYPFSGNANDASGNGHNATASGATLTVGHDGQANSAYSFNGTTSYIVTAADNALDSYHAGTVSFWFRAVNTVSDGAFMAYSTDGNLNSLYQFCISSKKLMAIYKYPTLGYNPTVTGSTTLLPNQWYHVAFVADGSSMLKIYLNGQMESVNFDNNGTNASGSEWFADITGVSSYNHFLSMGALRRGGGQENLFKGDLDDIRIYSRTLSASEVQFLAREGTTPVLKVSVATGPCTVIVSGTINVNVDPTGEDPLPGVLMLGTDNREDGSSYLAKVLYGSPPSYKSTPDTVRFQNVGDKVSFFAVGEDTAFGTADYNGSYQVSVNGVIYQLTKNNIVWLNSLATTQVLKVPVTPGMNYRVIVSGTINVNVDPTGEDPLPGVLLLGTDNREDGSSYLARILYGTPPSYKNSPDTVNFINTGNFLYFAAIGEDWAAGTASYNGSYQVSVNGTNYQLTEKNILWAQPTTSVSSPSSLTVSGFSLYQNYPNPFNPATTFRYAVPRRSHVTLTVFNLLGQLVATLVNGDIDAGYHDVKFDAAGLASGVYFYRLQAGAFVDSKKLLLVR